LSDEKTKPKKSIWKPGNQEKEKTGVMGSWIPGFQINQN
jgi:hypothetical protein